MDTDTTVTLADEMLANTHVTVDLMSREYLIRYTPLMTAAALIRRSRELAGLTQAELAAGAGTSQPTVAAYESGRQSPRTDTLERLLSVCGRRLTTQRIRPGRLGPVGRRLHLHRDELLQIVDRYDAHDVRVFGSVARGEDRSSSDLDLLVRLHPSPRPTLLRVGGLADEISTLLRCPVDVSTAELLRPEIRQEVLGEAVPL